MKTTGLISIDQLCDHGCTAVFYKRRLVIRNELGKIVIIGHRVPMEDKDYTNGMWMVNLNKNTPPLSVIHPTNAIILSDTTKTELVKLHHVSLGSPVKLTLVNAIDKRFLNTFPGLTKKIVNNHLPKSIQTCKDRMDQERQGLQSTKVRSTSKTPTPIDATPSTRTNIFIYTFLGPTKKIVNKYLPKSVQTYKDHMDQERQGLQSIKIRSISKNPRPIDATPSTRTKIFICAIASATDTIYINPTGKFPI